MAVVLNGLDSRIERYPEVIVSAKVQNIKRVDDNKFLVSVDVSECNSWVRRFDPILLEYYPHKIDIMDVLVEYIKRRDMAKYAGYYGWIATPADFSVGSGEEKEDFPGYSKYYNREIGCLSEKVGEKVAMPEEVVKLLHKKRETTYVRSCDNQTARIFVSKELAGAIIDAMEGYPNWIFDDSQSGPYRDGYILVYMVKGCQNKATCQAYNNFAYYPTIKTPNPEEKDVPLEDAKTSMTKYLISAIGGVMAKLKDPTFPDKLGVYAARGMQPPYPIASESKFPTCGNCIMCKRVGRGIPDVDDNAEMGQSSIAQQKADGIDPTWWCRAKSAWIEEIYRTMVDMNMQCVSTSSRLGQSEINKSAREAACDRFMWFVRFGGNMNPKVNREQHGAWHPWVPASRFVNFIDDDNPRIVAKMPSITAEMELSKQLVEYMRAFKIQYNF